MSENWDKYPSKAPKAQGEILKRLVMSDLVQLLNLQSFKNREKQKIVKLEKLD